jgi:undecaprenyl-diphosphatase
MLFLWVVHHRVSRLNDGFVGLTAIATGGYIWIALAPLLAWRARRALVVPLALAAAAVWASDLVATLLKRLIDRPRPYEAIAHVHLLVGRPLSASLPSSHATTSFAGATILSLLFPTRAAPLFLVATLVAFSRVYVGVHYPGDVLAGALLGSCVAAAVWLVAQAISRARWGG